MNWIFEYIPELRTEESEIRFDGRAARKCAAVDLVGCDVMRDARYPVTVSEGTGRGRWARAVCEQRW